jgi:pyruvate formate lyase activating enzyme
MSQESCPICIRECLIGHSFCNRRDENGYLRFKDRYCALLVDSLFDKPIIHFVPNIKVLSVGSWGCNMRCLGCQNVNLSWTTTGEGLGYSDMKPEEVVNLAIERGCEGISYTYNEPAILLDYVEEVALIARQKGLYNIFVTNSTLTPYSARKVSPLLDAVAADIKSMEDDFYYKFCGAVGILDVADKILDCIKTFHQSGCHVEVRTNIIQGANDQAANFYGIARWLKGNLGEDIPWHLTRFFPAHELSHLSPTAEETLLQAQKIGQEEGLKNVHVYLSKGCDCAKEESMISCCCCEDNKE